MIRGCQGLGGQDGQAEHGIVRAVLCGTVKVGVCHYTFVQTHRRHNSKVNPNKTMDFG